MAEDLRRLTPPSATRPAGPVGGRGAAERRLFSGVYGLVLASALAAALDGPHEPADDPGIDALWVLLTALASAAAHGYAHGVAVRASVGHRGLRGGLRLVTMEWPLVAATVPTLAMLMGSVARWWTEATAVSISLVLNTAALAGWGVWAARSAGRSWAASLRVGAVDLLIGLAIILANTLIK